MKIEFLSECKTFKTEKVQNKTSSGLQSFHTGWIKEDEKFDIVIFFFICTV